MIIFIHISHSLYVFHVQSCKQENIHRRMCLLFCLYYFIIIIFIPNSISLAQYFYYFYYFYFYCYYHKHYPHTYQLIPLCSQHLRLSGNKWLGAYVMYWLFEFLLTIKTWPLRPIYYETSFSSLIQHDSRLCLIGLIISVNNYALYSPTGTLSTEVGWRPLIKPDLRHVEFERV